MVITYDPITKISIGYLLTPAKSNSPLATTLKISYWNACVKVTLSNAWSRLGQGIALVTVIMGFEVRV